MTGEKPDKKPKPRRPGGKTNDPLDALIRSQIELTERMNTLTRDVAAMGIRQDQLVIATNEQIRALVEQVAAMVSAQTRTDEQMRLIAAEAGRRREGAESGEGVNENYSDADLPDRPTTREVALWLRKSPNAIYIWANKGLIPARRVGGSWLFEKIALIEWARNSPQLDA